MSSNNGDTTQTAAPLQKIEQAMLRVGAARQKYINASQTGAAPESLLRDYHAAVINYYMELRPYRDNSIISEQWTDATLWDTGENTVTGVDSLQAWISPTRSAQSQAAGRGTTKQTGREPDRLGAQQLVAVSMLLDDLAAQLGFAASTKQQTPHDEADKSDLKALLKARGQDEAAERVPAEVDE